MRIGSLLLAAVALVLAGVIGCANPLQGGEAITKYQKGNKPLLMTAPQEGKYQLYAELDKTPKATVVMKKGEPLGFRQVESGQINAVAGEQTFPVKDQTLIWRLKK